MSTWFSWIWPAADSDVDGMPPLPPTPPRPERINAAGVDDLIRELKEVLAERRKRLVFDD
jgi:hypothetical protein